MKRKNLNKLPLSYAYLHSPDANKTVEQKNHSVSVEGKIYAETHFKDLDEILIKKINEADAVVGCVAWLTHEGVIKALAGRKYGVSLIIQKEDFLRPDLNSNSNYPEKLRGLYSKLKAIKNRGESSFRKKTDFDWRGWEEDTWYDDAQQWIDISVRCVGFKKGKDEYAMPRMHHKFLVFCNYKEDEDYPFPTYEPYAVWTGSFNMTMNGTRSLENGIYIKNDKISQSYYGEWFNMLLLSEDLDWESEWAAPDVHHLDECAIIS